MKRFRGTLFILAVALAIQCVLWFVPEWTELFVFHTHSWSGWLALLPYMFAHANWPHLVGNFCGGIPFCIYLERKLGSRRFLEFYVLCGLGSVFLQTLLQGGGTIGSSGALFGVMTGACIHYGKTFWEHILAMALFSAHFINNLAMAPYGPLLGIAFYGHLGGGLAALLLCLRFYAHKLESMPSMPRQVKSSTFRFSKMGKRLKKHASRCSRLLWL